MLANNTDFVKIPSDIEPGTYIFRTELLALHANNPSMNTTALGGPQFYPHCFNVEILGNGASKPEGIMIPGAFVTADNSILMDICTGCARAHCLQRQTRQSCWASTRR